MIDDLDEALRALLVREMPIRNNEIDVTFDQPKKDWAARLSRPTLNLFLFDLRENTRLRREQAAYWEVDRSNNGVTMRRKPYRVDCFYMVTAWATVPEDEHRILSRALLTFLKFQDIPADLLPEGLQDQPIPIPIEVAQQDESRKPTDLWGVLDNQQRPAVFMVATVAFDPYAVFTQPLTRTAEFKFGPNDDPDAGRGFLSISGQVRSKKPLEDLQVVLVERGLAAEVLPDGRFGLRNIQPGNYTLEITAKGHKPHKKKIKVPAASYDVDL